MSGFDTKIAAVVAVAFTQGAMDFHGLALFYHYKDALRVSAGTMALIQAFVIVPWTLKPLFGLLSDRYPVWGSRRKGYLLGATCCELLCLLALSTLPPRVEEVVALQLLCATSLVFRNVIGEAMIVESSRRAATETERQLSAQRLISLFFGARSLGSLIFSFAGGYALRLISPARIFRLSAAFSGLLLVVMLLCYREASEEMLQPLVAERPKPLRAIARQLRRRGVRNLLIVVCVVLANPSLGPTMNYYYSEVLGFGPEQMGLLAFAASLAYLFGIAAFNALFKGVAFRPFYTATNAIVGGFGLANLALLFGLHRRVGLSDFGFALLVGAFGNFLAELNSLPVLAVGCRLCPPGLEATTYALFTAMLNAAGYVAGVLGSLLVYALRVQQRRFDNLWVIVAGQIAYSAVVTAALLCVPFGFEAEEAPAAGARKEIRHSE